MTNDRALAAWLREGPETGSPEARARVVTAIRDVRQQPAWLAAPMVGLADRGPVVGSPVRLAWLVVLTGLLVGLVLTGIFVGAASQRLVTPDPAPLGVEFTSPVHGYTVTIPNRAGPLRPASIPWPGDKPWLGGEARFVDVLDYRLVATSTVVEPGLSPTAWLAEYIPGRLQGGWCGRDGQAGRMGPSPVEPWLRVTIDGRPAYQRVQCMHLDAVAFVDGRAFVFSLEGPKDGDFGASPTTRARFEAFLATVTLPSVEP
jgi:hypothetical protein